MSNSRIFMPPTNGAGTTRPWAQRNELGPIVHDIGHDIYDQAEARLLELGDTGPLPLFSVANYRELGQLAGRMTIYIQGLVSDNTPLQGVITSYTQLGVPGKRNKRIPLTYYQRSRQVLTEGLTTGIAAPLSLYQAATVPAELTAKRMVEQHEGVDPDLFTDIPFDPKHASDTLVAPNFQRMLHFLALGANGSLAQAATQPRALGLGTMDLKPLRLPCISMDGRSVRSWDPYPDGEWIDVADFVNQVRHEQFEYDERGEVVGFTDQFKADFLKDQREAKAGWSGGCPVRHETFNRTGPLAAEHFRDQGQADGLPTRQGESLIARGSRLVSTVLAATVSVER